MESGLFLGWSVHFVTCCFSSAIDGKSCKTAIAKRLRCIFFMPCVVFFLLFGQWGNSAILGFTTLSLGILMKLFSSHE